MLRKQRDIRIRGKKNLCKRERRRSRANKGMDPRDEPCVRVMTSLMTFSSSTYLALVILNLSKYLSNIQTNGYEYGERGEKETTTGPPPPPAPSAQKRGKKRVAGQGEGGQRKGKA